MTRSSRNTRATRLIVAESAAMREVVAHIDRAAASDDPVLIQGEVGTGRELVARVIHAGGQRREAPFVPIEAGAVPAELFAAEADRETDDALSRARGGTLLIKDLCELSKRSQRRLHAFLRDRHELGGADARICATGDLDLDAAADAGVLHRALYDQLCATVIRVPALRERAEDIPALAGAVIKHFARELGRGRITVSTRAYERLASYPWPGNVAELKIICRRLAIRAKGGQISASDVDLAIPIIAERVPLEALPFEDLVRSKLASLLRRLEGHAISDLYDQVLRRVEKPLFDIILEHTGGNQVRAAEILGVNRNTLRRKLSEHGIRARLRSATRKRATAKAS
jgi:two-component system, NtrC family, nitrogen regulation response regulator GlnG